MPRSSVALPRKPPPNLWSLLKNRPIDNSRSGVPGEIRGLEYLHSKYGSLPWADLVDPSVRMAKQGFVVGKDMESQMDRINDEKLFLEDPAWAPEFAPHGKLLRAGDTITRPRLAKTLERISDGGADAFYTGVVAETMVAALRKRGGIMTLQDLHDYKITHRRPISIQYDGYRITGCGVPGGGVVSLATLNVLQRYFDRGEAAALNLTSHRLSEIMRFAFGAVSASSFSLWLSSGLIRHSAPSSETLTLWTGSSRTSKPCSAKPLPPRSEAKSATTTRSPLKPTTRTVWRYWKRKSSRSNSDWAI